MKNRETTNNFFDLVYEVTRKIPHGRITTYGAIAKSIGSPQAARMVGWALNKCYTQKEFVPAHRVVNRTGTLSGKKHFGSPDIMRELLESENVKIVDDKIVDFNRLFWDPIKELDLSVDYD